MINVTGFDFSMFGNSVVLQVCGYSIIMGSLYTEYLLATCLCSTET